MNHALDQARADTLARWRAILDVAFTAAVEARLKFKSSLEERHPADEVIWSHDNMHCTLVRPVVEPSDVSDEEALPGFEVRFDDGTQITAFKEELTDTDGRFAPMSEIVCRGFAAARDLGYAGPTHLLREAPIEHLSAFVEVTTRPAPEPQAQPAAEAITVARQELIDALAADQADSYISDIKGRHWLTARFIEGFVGFAQMSIQELLQAAVDANIAERHESAVATVEAAIAVGGSHVTEVRETVLQFTVLHDDDHDLSDRKLGDLADECDFGAYIGGEQKTGVDHPAHACTGRAPRDRPRRGRDVLLPQQRLAQRGRAGDREHAVSESLATFVITPKPLLRGFVRQEDRDYFARPVRVEVVRKDECGLVYVTDPVRGDTYPVQPRHLVKGWQLTRRQLAAAT